MKEIPLLMSTPMVRATLEERKDVTRRLRKLEDINKEPSDWTLVNVGDYKVTRANGSKFSGFGALFQYKPEPRHVIDIPSPFGKAGDVLWVRETWAKSYNAMASEAAGIGPIVGPYYDYKADNPEGKGWKPSIHMPKEACRLRLKVISVGVERLIDKLDDKEVVREGIHFDKDSGYWFAGDAAMSHSAFECFGELWTGLNGFDSWTSNPWVWRIEYKKL